MIQLPTWRSLLHTHLLISLRISIVQEKALDFHDFFQFHHADYIKNCRIVSLLSPLSLSIAPMPIDTKGGSRTLHPFVALLLKMYVRFMYMIPVYFF